MSFFLRGKLGQHFRAGAEGKKLVQGRLRAAAVGRFFKKVSSKEFLQILTSFYDSLDIINE